MSKEATRPTSDPTTLSTRFDAAEMDILRKAAELKGWSLSKLLRVGAYQKAAYILNSAGEAINPIRHLVSSVVGQLFNASLVSNSDLAHEDMVYEEMSIQGIEISSISETTFLDFVTSIKALGDELAPILEEERLRLLAKTSKIADLRTKLISPDTLRPDSELELKSASERAHERAGRQENPSRPGKGEQRAKKNRRKGK